MTRRDLSKFDASDVASSELGYVIKSQKRTVEPTVPSVTASEAMEEERLYESVSNRDVTRVLFISRNTDLLNPTQQSLDGYINISDLFDEVHILILRKGIPSRSPVLRVAKNVWLYTAASKIWWKTPFAGIKLVEEELEFAGGFRPDLIVARDPFESAVVASRLGAKYNRPTQLHVLENYGSNNFLLKDKHNYWRLFFPFFTVPKFSSIRTATETIKRRLEKNFEIPDLSILPRYQNYESLIESDLKINLKEKYKPLIFFMLYVGDLDAESSLQDVLDSASGILRNPRMGLIVLGNGPRKSEFQKRVKILGISPQVIFESGTSKVAQYLKSANLLVVSDADSRSEEIVLKGAAAGIAMVMSKTEKREDIFTDGESAFLYEQGDSETLHERINHLLNNIGQRREFVMNGQDIIRDNFHHNPLEYEKAYRNSVEQAFFATDDLDEEVES